MSEPTLPVEVLEPHRQPVHGIWRLPEVLRARWLLFVVTFALIFLGSIAAAYLRKPSYESEARLFVQLDQQEVSLSPSDTRVSQAVRVAEEAVATQAEMLASRDIVGKLVDELGESVLERKPSGDSWKVRLAAWLRGVLGSLRDMLASAGLISTLTPRDATIREIQQGLRILPARKTQVILVSFRTKLPEAAPLVLDTLIGLHLRKLAQINAYSEDYEFYRQQTSRFKDDLQKADQLLADFKQRYNVVDPAAEKAMLMQKIDQLTTVLDGVGRALPNPEAAFARDAGRVQPLENAPERGLLTESRPADAIIGASELPTLAARLNELRLERARRLTLYALGHASVQEMESQIASAESLLAREKQQVIRTANAYKARLAMLERLEPELNRHLRDSRTSAENYRTFASAAENRRLAREQQSRVVVLVVDPPMIPDAPLGPNRLTLILAGFFGALALALAAVMVREWATIRTSRGGRDVAGAATG